MNTPFPFFLHHPRSIYEFGYSLSTPAAVGLITGIDI